MLVIVTSIA